LSIEEKPMGCFCERLPNQGSVRHMEIVSLFPDKANSPSATGNMQIALSPLDGGTKLGVTYAVTEQFTRLKTLIEHN
jgi:hypothetical protein